MKTCKLGGLFHKNLQSKYKFANSKDANPGHGWGGGEVHREWERGGCRQRGRTSDAIGKVSEIFIRNIFEIGKFRICYCIQVFARGSPPYWDKDLVWSRRMWVLSCDCKGVQVSSLPSHNHYCHHLCIFIFVLVDLILSLQWCQSLTTIIVTLQSFFNSLRFPIQQLGWRRSELSTL